MNDSIYYKATDEDGNIVIKHGWKHHKYLYIKNGKYVYPEDVKKNVKKKAKFVKKVVTRDAAFKAAAARYLLDKASKSPTANAARAKANSVKSNVEYKLTRAGEKFTNDVKSSGAYKSAKKGYKSAKKGINRISKNANKAYKSVKKGINSIPKNVNKAYKSAKDSIPTAAEVRNKANSVKSNVEYKLTRAGDKFTNDVKRSGAYKSAKKGYKSAKKGINRISKNANKAYKSAKKEINRISRDANKVYKSAKKKAKKVNRTFNKVKRAGKAYLDYLTK